MTGSDLNEKMMKQWNEFAKTFSEVGKETANETANAAVDVLKTLAKELGSLGDKLEKWVESSKKPDAPQAADAAEKDPPQQT